MDDFGNTIRDFCKPGIAGFAAFVLCAECPWGSRWASEQYMRTVGVIE